MKLEWTSHVSERMAERGIALEDVRSVLRRPVTGPLPGDGGNLIFEGYTSGGRLLRVVVTSNRLTVVTAMWRK
ncbi:MAG: DUF4258 domain-containing protein [Candidatus Nanopelagicales bacterium]